MDSYYAKTAVEDRVGKKAFKAMSYGEREKAYQDEFERQGFEKRDGKWVKKTGTGSKSLRYGESIKKGKVMKIKESKLKNIIRQAIKEVVTEEKTYKAKKKDGKVVVFKNKDNWKKALKTGDYEKVDSKKKDKLPFKPDSKISSDPFDGDVGGPAYPNVPKGAKTSKQAKGMKKAQDLATSAIPKKKEEWDYDKFQDMFYNNTPDKSLKKNVDNITNTFIKALDKFKKDGVEFAGDEAASIKSDMIDNYIEKRF